MQPSSELQLLLPGVRPNPTSREIREYVRAEVARGFAFRQAARQAKREEANQSARKRRRIQQRRKGARP